MPLYISTTTDMRERKKTNQGRRMCLFVSATSRSGRSGWSASSLYGGPLPNFDCWRRILSELVLQNHCPEAAMPKQSAYITQGCKGCFSCCCAFKEVVKYGSAIGALLPFSLSLSLHLSPSPLPVRMGCAFRGHITYLLTYRT